MQYGDDYKLIPATSIASGLGQLVLPDVYCHTIQVVNICLIGKDRDNFFLMDAGMPGSADDIISLTEERFGEGAKPKAILLTHGHFDHVGAIIELIEHWQIPVFAHELEMPYLTGRTDYPTPDSSVEGGVIAKMSPLFPNEAINLGNRVERLPDNGSVPFMEGWKWIHTPGHTPGHVSFFREMDRTLVVGDAFVTVRQDSLYKVFTQELEISGPPRYLTIDWKAAKESVERLASLEPEVAVVGHGMPLTGRDLREGLKKLVAEFDQVAVPDYGRFVDGSKGN